jgi:hypothetical protein
LAADDAARETAAKEQSTRRLCLAVRARFSRGRAARIERDRMSAESQSQHLDILREANWIAPRHRVIGRAVHVSLLEVNTKYQAD